MARESDKNVFLIQIDASNFAEFEISEFEISRVDCTLLNLYQIKIHFDTSHNKNC